MYLRATLRERGPWYFELMAKAFSRKRRERSYSITPWSTRPILLYIREKMNKVRRCSTSLSLTEHRKFNYHASTLQGFSQEQIKLFRWSDTEMSCLLFKAIHFLRCAVLKKTQKRELNVAGLHRAEPFQDGLLHTPSAWGIGHGTTVSGQWTADHWQSNTGLSASVKKRI